MQRFDYDSIDSTNAQARRLMAEHPGRVLLVTASEQTAGRGRRGRTWQSPRGGAWMSLVWPQSLPAEQYAQVPLVAALATWRTIRQVLSDVASRIVDDLKIKWPNDLLLGGRKAGGVLCERVVQPAWSDARPESLIVGVGINVGFDLSLLQGDLRSPATTLRQASGMSVEVETVIERFAATAPRLLHQFERQQGLTSAMLADLRAHLALVGETVTVASAGRHVAGVVDGLDDHGRLLLATDSEVVACDTGEVTEVHGN